MRCHLCLLPLFILAALNILLLPLLGCGGAGATTGGGTSNPPPPSETTHVTFLLSSTGNDKLTSFALDAPWLTITSQSGKAVTVSTLQSSSSSWEFAHLNGISEPVLAADIPQNTYTGASLEYSFVNFMFFFPWTGENIPICGVNQTAPSTVSTNLPSPIVVSGSDMALILSLSLSQSANYAGASCSTLSATISPTLSLAPLTLVDSPTNFSNGLQQDLNGAVESVDPANGNFTIETFDSATLTIKTSVSTAFSGIGGLSQLEVGQFVNLDAALQGDGSLLATRVEVEDTSVDMSTGDYATGPIIATNYSSSSSPAPGLVEAAVQAQGPDASIGTLRGAPEFGITSSTIYRVSSQFVLPADLNPAAYTFSPTNEVPGQYIYVTILSNSINGGFTFPANTVTLMPQTIDAVVQSCATPTYSNATTTCNVTLAPYDPITLFSGASTISVEVPSNVVQTSPLVLGSPIRFHGLLFNNNGTPDMICNLIMAGVPQ